MGQVGEDIGLEAPDLEPGRLDACDEVQRSGAERVEVGGGVGARLKLLGRHVAEGADHARAAGTRVQHGLAHGAKVDEDAVAVGPKH